MTTPGRRPGTIDTPHREPWRERWVAAVLRFALRRLLLPTFRADRPIPRQRRRLERIARLTLPPRGVRIEAGACGGVRGEWIHAAGAPKSTAAILYLHGGAYCIGGPATHRAVAGTLARRTGATVFLADYRLAPEHPFPAAVHDAVAAYRGLLAQGLAPAQVAIAGDSAGGGLALATAMQLRELGEALPAALVAFSPWVDLGAPDRGPVPTGEVMVTPSWVAECARLYLAGCDPRTPLASPIHGELHGLPPTLVQVGTDELLLSDSRRLHAALTAASVRSQLEEFPRRWHVFQANAGVLADADRALERAAHFLRERWDSRPER
ncbi:MAG TPA: alpha/beta hydrolase [Steroidobacteraceae bacterium]|nr:alpha/beta hydrolase [Steroidobacteraceae bacterium]